MSTISKLRRVLLAVSVAAGFTAACVATAEAQSTRWGGVYLGAHLGGAALDANVRHVQPAGNDPISHSAGGWTLGGHGGAQGQWGQWVAGVEVSWSYVDLDDTVTSTVIPNRSRSIRVDSLFLASLRLGFAMDRTLVYIKGGYANAEVDVISNVVSTGEPRSYSSKREDGWNIGVGIEYAWTQNLVLGFQYDYVNLDGTDRTNVQAPGFPVTAHRDIDVDIHKVTARLSYKFN